jgi:hypothetical protein
MSRNVKGGSNWNRHNPYLTVDRMTSYVTQELVLYWSLSATGLQGNKNRYHTTTWRKKYFGKGTAAIYTRKIEMRILFAQMWLLLIFTYTVFLQKND